MLNQTQIAMLKDAASAPYEVRSKRIEAATSFIKDQSSSKFFIDVNGKPDPALKQRVFYDEPRNLELSDYAGCVVPYKGIEQAKTFNKRG
jgi:hypothetical protein